AEAELVFARREADRHRSRRPVTIQLRHPADAVTGVPHQGAHRIRVVAASRRLDARQGQFDARGAPRLAGRGGVADAVAVLRRADVALDADRFFGQLAQEHALDGGVGLAAELALAGARQVQLFLRASHADERQSAFLLDLVLLAALQRADVRDETLF